MYHYANVCSVELISPSIKNRYHFTKELHIQDYYGRTKSSSNYYANKAHARDNLKYWMNYSGCKYIKTRNFNKRIFDIADSFIQLQAWRGYKMVKPRETKIEVKAEDPEAERDRLINEIEEIIDIDKFMKKETKTIDPIKSETDDLIKRIETDGLNLDELTIDMSLYPSVAIDKNDPYKIK